MSGGKLTMANAIASASKVETQKGRKHLSIKANVGNNNNEIDEKLGKLEAEFFKDKMIDPITSAGNKIKSDKKATTAAAKRKPGRPKKQQPTNNNNNSSSYTKAPTSDEEKRHISEKESLIIRINAQIIYYKDRLPANITPIPANTPYTIQQLQHHYDVIMKYAKVGNHGMALKKFLCTVARGLESAFTHLSFGIDINGYSQVLDHEFTNNPESRDVLNDVAVDFLPYLNTLQNPKLQLLFIMYNTASKVADINKLHEVKGSNIQVPPTNEVRHV